MIPMATPFFGRTAGGAAPFNPADLNPYAWFYGDNQPEADLALIPTLLDGSGNGRDFAQATSGNRGYLQHNHLNGHKTVRFGDGGSKFYDRANTFFAGESAGHYYWLFKAEADPAAGGADGALHGEIENHGGDTHIPYGDGNCYTGFISNERRSPNPVWELNDWNIWEEWSVNNDWGIKINGEIVATDNTNVISIGTNTRTIGRGNIGSTTLGYFNGRMAQMLYFNSKLSDANAILLRKYLAEFGAITPKLILGHDGKSYPSTTYWRIRCRDSNGSNDAFGMRELEMYASTDGTGTNLCTGGTGIASFENGGWPIANAFNGNTADFWTSLGSAPPAGGHWIGRILTAPAAVGSFRVNTRGDFNETPQNYALEYSLDAGSTWKIMKNGGPIAGNVWVVLPT